MRNARGLAGAAVVLAAVLVAAGCGESRQEKFEKALAASEVAKTALDSARKDLGKCESAYQEAQAEAEAARNDLERAQQSFEAASSTFENARLEVARWADDASVTRVLQQRLLADAALERAAVSARVEQGTAILAGSVPTSDVAERAAEIARETPGVAEVRSDLTVTGLGSDLPTEPAPPAAFPPEPPEVPATPAPPVPEAPAPEPPAAH
jgi:osmotically-inducible protein OsmY